MNFDLSETGDVKILQLPPSALDASNAKDFKEDITPFLTSGAKLVINMADLEFVDSTGLGALVSALKQARAVHAEIKLCSLTKPVLMLFELVRMHRVFDLFDNPEQAIASYQSSA